MGDTNEFEEDTNLRPPVDSFHEAIEKIQFGSMEEGAASLKAAITSGYQDQEAKRKVADESARSAEVLAEFRRRNAGLNDPVLEPSIERQALIEQANDLKAVIDYEAWRNQLGREPSVADIVSAHLHFRAHKAPKIRSSEEILEKAASVVADKFGIRRQGAINSTQTIRDRQSAARKARGLTPLEYGDRSSDSDQHVATTVSASDYTKALMGYDDEGSPADQSSGRQPAQDERAGRISATQRMVLQRKAARGTNVKLLERE